MTAGERGAPAGRVSGRAVLVTGASRGIGRAIAEAFAGQGDRVAVHYRSSPGQAAGVLAGLPGHGHLLVRADLADPQAVRQMVDQAWEALGGLDVLVNNAGVFTAHPVTQVSYEQWQAAWQQTLAVNLTGAANVTWCAVQHMIAGGGGRIINVSSRGAFRGEPGQPAYGASKAGLNAFGQSLAAPAGDQIRGQSPFGRVARPDEIAAAVLYLAAAGSEWASGAILDLNGASYLR